MATTSSSLVVRISADLNDFTKGLNQATRDVDKAAKKIEGFGKALTLGITVPVAAAAVALAKMASENEDTAARLERVFGAAANSVNASIKKMMAGVPETNTDLQKMAITVDNMAQGLGLAPANAAKMSESLLRLAGDASAFAHVPMAEALDALSRGLAGKTRGLLQFGIAINEAEIKAKALSMGLVHQGNELTETGTALAAYALIMEKSTRISGEAERTAGQMGKSFAFLKRDLSELADNVSGLVLPALSWLARSARDLTGILASADTAAVKTFFGIAAGAALIGPAIILVVKMIDGLFKLRAAFALLSAGAGATGFFAALAAAPLGTVIAGIVAITGALGALYLVWQKFKTGPDLTGPLGGSDPTLNKALGIGPAATPALSGKNGATERSPAVDAMKALEERAANVSAALKQMGDGWEAPGLAKEFAQTLGAVWTAIDKIGNALDPVAVKLRGIVKDMQDAAGTAFTTPNLASLSSLPGLAAPLKTGVVIPNPQEAALPGMTAANEAAMRYAKTQEYVTETIAYDYQALRSNLSQFGINLSNVGEKMQGVIVTLADAATNFAMQLANRAGGSGKGASTGRGIGGLLGAAVGFVGGPVGSAIGAVIGTAAGGLIGGLFDHAKKSTDTAATAMDSLAKTVDRVSASITNVPAYFKIQYYRFTASPTYSAPSPPPPGGSYTPPGSTPSTPMDPNDPNGGTNIPGAPSGNIIIHNLNLPNVSDVESFRRELAFATLKARNTGNVTAFAFG